MAGSRRDFDYVSDDGDVFGINADESNVRLMNATTGNLAAPTAIHRKPSNFTLRRAILSDSTGTIKRTVPILTAADYNSLTAGQTFTLPSYDPDATSVVRVVAKIPERYKRLIRVFDTGKTDGTQP